MFEGLKKEGGIMKRTQIKNAIKMIAKHFEAKGYNVYEGFVIDAIIYDMTRYKRYFYFNRDGSFSHNGAFNYEVRQSLHIERNEVTTGIFRDVGPTSWKKIDIKSDGETLTETVKEVSL